MTGVWGGSGCFVAPQGGAASSSSAPWHFEHRGSYQTTTPSSFTSQHPSFRRFNRF
jgi:hypothetical protein